MNKTALLIARIACLAVVGCFFFSYFVVSCNGKELTISGIDAALGADKKGIELNAQVWFLLIPGVALAVLVALGAPSIQEKLKQVKSPVSRISVSGCITIIGGIAGLLLLTIAHNWALGKVRQGISREIGGYGLSLDISSVYHTGLGFKASVLAFIVMLVLPFVEKYLRTKNAGESPGEEAGASPAPAPVEAPPEPVFTGSYTVLKETALKDSLSPVAKTICLLQVGEKVIVSHVNDRPDLGGKWALLTTETHKEGWCPLEVLKEGE